MNAGKRSVALDLTTSEGTRILARLLATADVVIEASRPRALQQLGLDADRLTSTGPQVWVSITGHGRAEPGAGWVGFGDDAAVAGGLVACDAAGPIFCADAVADPRLAAFTRAMLAGESIPTLAPVPGTDPVAYLDRLSSTRYSSRAAQASGCAADAGVFPAYLDLLFAEQPPPNSAGLPDDRLIALGRQAGAGDEFAQCVQDERYAGWTRSVTEAAAQAGVTATPTVLVNGTPVPRTADALRVAVAAAG